MVDHVRRDQFVEGGVVAGLLAAEHPSTTSFAVRSLMGPTSYIGSTGPVGGTHADGVPGRPLHQLDAVAVGIDDPRREEAGRAVRRRGCLGTDTARRQLQ